ncbi:SepM family pheromone-processing serine protease [Paenibacillus sediminis]|uniref:endopeptidase La n=1 Tax=Paenibacillus sediminis TaxID=664909 RepID=A0ABS4H1R5_9BACL|nr:SepM family pheromone-processing serine protease [Paenibacillus sediminis]MBP1936469.1 PDZ domain-containing protein [Paenibacillus sediminis]
MRQQRNSQGLKTTLYLITVIFMVYVVVFMPTPYMVNQPGSAEEIKPLVKVHDGDPAEKGTFMLTTVSVSYANIAMMVMAAVNPDAELSPKPKNISKQEYTTEQVYYMAQSQSSAMMAAYNKAGIPYKMVTDYIFIVSIPEGITPKGDFRSGDKIIEINGQPIHQFEDLASIMKNKKPGDQVTVTLIRDQQKITQHVELISLKSDQESSMTKAGLGVNIGQVQKVEPKDPSKQVTFTSTNIGGPSAGLMFSLEIYNQLTQGDLSKGYRIAGTGTIDEDGKVGPIGGVQFKIIAADREHAEIFFVPESNYQDAAKKAKQIGTSMKLVPVKTMDDALRYIEKLPVKSE